MLTSEHVARTIEQKAKKVMGMLKRGVKFTPTQPDINEDIGKIEAGKIVFIWLYFGSNNFLITVA